MRIGFTERGDGGLDLTWANKLEQVDGLIVVTKNLNTTARKAILAATSTLNGAVIVHATITGQGASVIEPRVPHPTTALDMAEALVNEGFPLDHLVIRVDPIIPNQHGLILASKVIEGAKIRGLLNENGPTARLRISIADDYRHVKQRFQALGLAPIYDGNRFSPNDTELAATLRYLVRHVPKSIDVRTCAEPRLGEVAEMLRKRGEDVPNIVAEGCLSLTDLKLMRLDDRPDVPKTVNGQSRSGCLCLTCKKELLTSRKRCQHGCAYCYWKD